MLNVCFVNWAEESTHFFYLSDPSRMPVNDSDCLGRRARRRAAGRRQERLSGMEACVCSRGVGRAGRSWGRGGGLRPRGGGSTPPRWARLSERHREPAPDEAGPSTRTPTRLFSTEGSRALPRPGVLLRAVSASETHGLWSWALS